MKTLLKRFLNLVLVLHFSTATCQTIAEQLGYEKDAKLLIIHADDLGVTHSENRASIQGLESTPVNSASIMVPCPWFLEIADYAQENKTLDLGLHLTLNSEWNFYKWGPVSSKDSVRSLVDANGYFFDNIPEVVEKGNPEEVKIELQNQVEMALRNGIDVTHLDAHMGTAGATKEFLKSYISVGNEFKLPVLLDGANPSMQDGEIKELVKNGNQIIVDGIYTAYPTHFQEGMADFYTKTLNELQAGLNIILIHLAYDDEEMQAVTVEKEFWGASWRQADVDFFSSDSVGQLLRNNEITLVTWREIRDKILRKQVQH